MLANVKPEIGAIVTKSSPLLPEWYPQVEAFQYFAFRGDGPHSDRVAAAIDIRRRIFQDHYGAACQIKADEFDREAIHILIYHGAEAVCSCRITSQESQVGLELARVVDVGRLLQNGRVFAEISKLVIAQGWRRVTAQSFLLLGLTKLSFAVAQQQGFTDYLIWVVRELQPIYRRMGFVDVPGLRFEHPRLGNLVHQVMRLDLKFVSRDRDRSWVSRVFYDPLPPNMVLLS